MTRLPLLLLLLFGFNACQVDCANEDPRLRMVNNSNRNATLTVITAEQDTFKFFAMIPGSASEWRSYDKGAASIILSTTPDGAVNDSRVVELNKCWEYEVEIDSNLVFVLRQEKRD